MLIVSQVDPLSSVLTQDRHGQWRRWCRRHASEQFRHFIGQLSERLAQTRVSVAHFWRKFLFARSIQLGVQNTDLLTLCCYRNIYSGSE